MIHTTASFKNRNRSLPLVIPFLKGGRLACGKLEISTAIKDPLSCGDFDGKEKDIVVVYHEKERVVLLGIGDGTSDNVRKSYGALSNFCKKKKWKALNLLLPKGKAREMAEGLVAANYAFDQHKKEKTTLLTALYLIVPRADEKEAALKAFKIAEGINLTRDLINGNADDITPQYLSKIALDLGKSHPKVKTQILDKKAIEKEKMGLLLAVNRGSHIDPALIIVHYEGHPKSKERTVIVGKGITYDTGGLNLKPTGSMETMRTDMGGGATALGIIRAAAELQLKHNVTAIIASTENAIDSHSYKPGDVYYSMNGTSVEITNTDAEGRLVLADALSYAIKHFNPTRLIDFATLTGAIEIALGLERSGLFCNDSALEKALIKAGDVTGEKVWPFPLDQAYRDYLKSDIADIANAKRRLAGSITAAVFLKEFVGETSWAHFDIANTAYISEGKYYGTTPASGVGVRLILEFLEGLNARSKSKGK